MSEEPNSSLISSLLSGDIFKVSNGHWKLKDLGDGRTEATYWVEANFKVFVPSPIAKKLVKSNLPNMMKSYHQRISELFGS